MYKDYTIWYYNYNIILFLNQYKSNYLNICLEKLFLIFIRSRLVLHSFFPRRKVTCTESRGGEVTNLKMTLPFWVKKGMATGKYIHHELS